MPERMSGLKAGGLVLGGILVIAGLGKLLGPERHTRCGVTRELYRTGSVSYTVVDQGRESVYIDSRHNGYDTLDDTGFGGRNSSRKRMTRVFGGLSREEARQAMHDAREAYARGDRSEESVAVHKFGELVTTFGHCREN